MFCQINEKEALVRRTLGACPAPAPPPCQAGAFFWFAVLAEMPGRGPGGAGLQAIPRRGVWVPRARCPARRLVDRVHQFETQELT